MARARSVSEVLSMKRPAFPFKDEWHLAFSCPERVGVWLIWGNSGSGKTRFAFQLCKYLCGFERVIYNSLEEGACLNIQNALIACEMQEVNKRFLLLDGEPMEELSDRLSKKRSPGIVVIDSFQYAQMNYRQYIRFKEAHKDKLLIFVSHADGKMPAGRTARSVMYDASLKVYVEGYRAFSKGRFMGDKAAYDIWMEGANQYWGNNILDDDYER
jgi:hypothetical protein